MIRTYRNVRIDSNSPIWMYNFSVLLWYDHWPLLTRFKVKKALCKHHTELIALLGRSITLPTLPLNICVSKLTSIKYWSGIFHMHQSCTSTILYALNKWSIKMEKKFFLPNLFFHCLTRKVNRLVDPFIFFHFDCSVLLWLCSLVIGIAIWSASMPPKQQFQKKAASHWF